MSTAPDDRFAQPDVAELTIELATQEWSAIGESGERSAMKAIAVVVVLSENRAEGLVRPVYRRDGRGGS